MKSKYSYAILTLSLSLNLIAQTNNSFSGSIKHYNQTSKPRSNLTQTEVEDLLIKMGYADRNNAEVRANAIFEQNGFQQFSQHHLSEKSGPNWRPEHIVREFAERLGYSRNSYAEASANLSQYEKMDIERLIKAFSFQNGVPEKDILSHPNFNGHLQEAILKYRTSENIKRGANEHIYPEDRTLMNPITLEPEHVGRASRFELIARFVVMSVMKDIDDELKHRSKRLGRLESETEFSKLTPAQQDSAYKEVYEIMKSYLKQGKKELSQLRSLALELSSIDEAAAKKVFGFATYENMNLEDFVKELRKHRREKLSFFRYTQLHEALVHNVTDFQLISPYSEKGKIDRHNAFLSIYGKIQFVNNNLSTDVEVIQGSKSLNTEAKKKIAYIKNKQQSSSTISRSKETVEKAVSSSPLKCSALFTK